MSRVISPEELNTLLKKESALTLNDVCSPAEFRSQHIAESLNIPLDQLTSPAFFEAHLKSRPVYLICASGLRSQTAVDKLTKAGYQACSVAGGLAAWEKANLPLVKGENTVISLERQIRIAAGSLILSGVILSYLLHPGWIWLSGFVGAGLIFAGVTNWCGMGILISKLPWNQNH